jgi:hypothetical protein
VGSGSGFDDAQLKRLQDGLRASSERSQSGSLFLLSYNARMLWDTWLMLHNDEVRVRSERLREQLKQATSKSLQALKEGLLESLDKSSDSEIAAAKVAVKPLDISPTLRIAILGYPYWIALLLLVSAAGLATARRETSDGATPTILSLRAGNWLDRPYRIVRTLACAFPVIVGILVGIEMHPVIGDSVFTAIYYSGIVLSAIFAAAVFSAV